MWCPIRFYLWSILFILFIYDIINTSPTTEFLMFANDTNLFFKDNNVSDLYHKVNNELAKVSEWFKLQKLSLNFNKTNYILFKNERKNFHK